MTDPIVIPMGPTVLCDWCGEDLTTDTRTGGFLFQSKAVGPCCAERTEKDVRSYGEERFIRGRCTPGMAFADWVRELRAQVPGGDSITIHRGLPPR